LLFSKTFILITLGFTWVSFTLGAVAWWGPKFLQLAQNDKKTEAK
jgi:hypothetical protein